MTYTRGYQWQPGRSPRKNKCGSIGGSEERQKTLLIDIHVLCIASSNAVNMQETLRVKKHC